jgi:hypothetical protein
MKSKQTKGRLTYQAMKVVSFLRAVTIVLVSTAVGYAPLSHAQGARTHGADEMQVKLIGAKVVDAIKNRDTNLLSSVVDPNGIYLGSDSAKISAAQFRKELSEQRGAYCVIFDVSCEKGGFQKSPMGFSLRDALMREPVTLSASDATAHPQDMAVEVERAQHTDEVPFTLFFRRVGNSWKLQQIEYF